jgi:hypothetical protein
MSAWSPAAAAVLAFSVWRAFAGAPPARSRPRASLLLAPAALVAYAASLLALVAGEDALALFGLIVGVESACLTAWLARTGGDGPADDEDRGGGGGGPGVGPEGPAPSGGGGLSIDWGSFDRERDGWERPVGVS